MRDLLENLTAKIIAALSPAKQALGFAQPVANGQPLIVDVPVGGVYRVTVGITAASIASGSVTMKQCDELLFTFNAGARSAIVDLHSGYPVTFTAAGLPGAGSATVVVQQSSWEDRA